MPGAVDTGLTFTPRVWNGSIYYGITANLTGAGSGNRGTTIDFTLQAVSDAGRRITTVYDEVHAQLGRAERAACP